MQRSKLGAVLDLDGTVVVRKDIARDGATGEAAVQLAIELALALQSLCTVPLLGVGVLKQSLGNT